MKQLPVKAVILFLFLLALLPAFLGFVRGPLKIRSRAAQPEVSPEDLKLTNKSASLKKLATLSDDIEDPAPASEIVAYHPPSSDFEITYNPSLWSPSALPQTPLTQPSLTLSLNPSFGYATLSVASLTSTERETLINSEKSRKTVTGFTDLDYFARNQSLLQDKSGTPLIAQEKVVIRNLQSNKLTFTESVLAQDLPFEIYLFDANTRFFIVTVKYGQIGAGKQQAEILLQNLDLSPPFTSEVKGANTRKDRTLNKYEAVQIAEMVKPSVVKILHVTCKRINIPSAAQSVKYLKTTYRFCLGATGSGWIISQAGHVATNGHVAKIYPEEALIEGFFDPQLRPFVSDLVREALLAATGSEISSSQADTLINANRNNPSFTGALMEAVYELLDKKVISLSDDATKLYVKLANDPFDIDSEKTRKGDLIDAVKTTRTIVEAKVVSVDFPNLFSPDVVIRKTKPKGSDVAVLKIESEDGIKFPSLKLGNAESLKEGFPLLIVGYPGLVEGGDEYGILDYKTSSVKPSITKGIVSAIKQDESGRTLIQTDASIDNGNSGGPAFNEQGEVIGIATYGFDSGSGNYNFLRDIADVKTLIESNQIDSAETAVYKTWQAGLAEFWNDYYTHSIKYFKRVKNDYPVHPTVDDFITEAQAAIKDGQDRGLLFGMDKSLATGFIISAVLLALLTGAIVVASLKKKGKQIYIPLSPSRSDSS